MHEIEVFHAAGCRISDSFEATIHHCTVVYTNGLHKSDHGSERSICFIILHTSSCAFCLLD
jgi:hypothetical protein